MANEGETSLKSDASVDYKHNNFACDSDWDSIEVINELEENIASEFIDEAILKNSEEDTEDGDLVVTEGTESNHSEDGENKSQDENEEFQTEALPQQTAGPATSSSSLTIDSAEPPLMARSRRIGRRGMITDKSDPKVAPSNFVDVPDYGYMGMDGAFQTPF